MEKLVMFQARFGQVDGFGWLDMERIKTDSGMQFTSKYFQGVVSLQGVQLALAVTDYQEINGLVEVTWQTLQTISYSIMVHAQFSDKYIHSTLIYINYHILPVISIKHLVNQYSEPTTPHKLATTIKPSL